MSGDSEREYYENPDLWRSERYLDDEGELQRFRVALDMIAEKRASLLDAGTGNGAFLQLIEAHRPAMRLVGLERSETAIRHSVCAAPIHRGSIEALPFASGSFECVSALEVLEHLPFGVYEAGLTELQRVAAEQIVVSVPFRETRKRSVCPYCGCTFNTHYHMRTFDEPQITAMFPSFVLSRFELIHVEEYRLLGPLRAARRKRGFTGKARCPQCGYHRSEGAEPIHRPAEPVGRPALKRLAGRAVRLLPKRARPNWIVATYDRR